MLYVLTSYSGEWKFPPCHILQQVNVLSIRIVAEAFYTLE
jgi:hypothetical protein